MSLPDKHTVMAVIGVDLGGTKIAAAIFDHFGNMKAKEVRLLDGAEGDKVGKLVTQTILHQVEILHLLMLKLLLSI